MNANNQFRISTGNKAKASEKLSSGYKINRAADDAAGLSISEKMRYQIRTLNRGIENAEDGVSWLQVGDGALNEVHAILQRMRELTIQSLNDTNAEEERAALQAEFDQLQSEIDQIAGTTQFNTKNIFEDHELPYYQCEGNITWDQSQPHVISGGSNDLVIQYQKTAGDTPQEVSITVPAGTYTTQELMDEIEDAFINQGLDKQGIMFEYTQYGTCNLNLEGGEVIDSVGGGLSYLLYDTYAGGGFGALVGTTVFASEYAKMDISNENNTLSFDIESFDGTKSNKSITIPNGSYTKQEIIDYLNAELAGTDVTATEYGTGIKLQGQNSIVTGFKGNMFKIDEGGKIYHSVFYDNVKYGSIKMTAASFTGGAVKPTGTDNEEHWKYVIDTTNQELTIQPNGAETPVTLTIPEGEYTVEQMVSKLNELFRSENMELDAIVYSNGNYKGIRINSRIKGITSEIGIDTKSSAFDTLFVNRVYNSYGTKATEYRETLADRDASVLGAKSFSADNLPLEITTGVNDKFTLSIDGTGYIITLDAGTYTTANAIVDNINQQLTGASALTGYKDKVTATLSGNQVKLTAAGESGITNLRVDAIGDNQGYTDIFVKTTISYVSTPVTGTGSATTKPSITLKNPVSDPADIDTGNNTLDITLNGNKHTVTLPTGQLTHDQIIEEIEQQIPETTEIQNITFNDVNTTGSSSNRNFNVSQSGNAVVNSKTYSNAGSSDMEEGNVGYYENNVPATITFSQAIPSSMEITDDCNQLQLTLNDVTKSLTLTNGTYSSDALVKEIQKQIDSEFGTSYGGAVASLDSSGKLVLTSRLKYPDGLEGPGNQTNIYCNTTTSSFLSRLHTVETAASVQSTVALQNNITITDESNTFLFTYGNENGTQDVALTLSNGTYTRNSLVSEINKQLAAGGYEVTAGLNGSYLQLKTNDTGKETSISYNSNNGGTSVETLFGDLTKETPASATVARDIQENITIDESSNLFNISVNGITQNLTLDSGTYTGSEFVDMLNRKFADNNAGVTASLTGNRLTYTTDAVGNNAGISMTYAGGGNAMQAIYGQKEIIHPGVDASFTQDGNLVLTSTQNGGSISVTPEEDNLFLEPEEKVTTTLPTTTIGRTSTNHSYIDGVNIKEPVTIDNWNNELNFTYYENGISNKVSFTVEEGDYSFDAMQTYLQNQIDDAVGAGKLTVTVGVSGIRMETVEAGSKYYITGFSGDFYKKVLCSCTEIQTKTNTTNSNGTQTNDLAYTIGRKDIRNGETLIRKGINDTLSMDFTYGGTTKELSITLDAGSYNGERLVQEIQKKLDEQLQAEGLDAGTIEVGIGGVNSNVTGSNNDALVFKLSQSVKLPAEGQYIIDGVSGNAAFSIFYQTEGELEPAYLSGTKDISEGVTIKPGETELTYKVDNVDYSIQIPEGTYTSEELINEMNTQFVATNAPVIAEMRDNYVSIVYSTMGNHTISEVGGSAKNEIFFQENGETGTRTGIKIQMSGQVGDTVEIDRPIMNTLYLKINSVTISQPKYANKALDRLDYAVKKVSEVRSGFGSKQNRLERAINYNENTAENLQNSESKIRDTDMEEEMVNHSKQAILQQVSQSMMAQAKKQSENVLQLITSNHV